MYYQSLKINSIYFMIFVSGQTNIGKKFYSV